MSTETGAASTLPADAGHQGESLAGEAHGHPEQVPAHPSTKLYFVIAVVLAVLTALEIWAGESDDLPGQVPALLIMMAIKFVLVVLFFMHLRFDAKIFGRLFWTGLVLALGVYVATLTTFHFFD